MTRKETAKKLAFKVATDAIDFEIGTIDLFRLPRTEKYQVEGQKALLRLNNKVREKGGVSSKTHLILRKKDLVEVVK